METWVLKAKTRLGVDRTGLLRSLFAGVPVSFTRVPVSQFTVFLGSRCVLPCLLVLALVVLVGRLMMVTSGCVMLCCIQMMLG